jgi:hypothetical protein
MEDDLILVVNGNMLGIKNQKSGERVIVDISKGTRQKSRYDEGGEIRWQDVQRGDSALVKSENKMGVIMKAYGRKFHLKFIDGTEKTYDANDLKFISSDDFAEGGLMKDFNKNFTTAYILQQQLAEKEKESQSVPSDVTTDYNYETTYYNEKYYPSRSHDGEKFASKELYNALRDGSGNLKGSNEKDIESQITAYFDENMVKTISGKDLHKMWKEGKGINVEKKKKGWFGFKEGGGIPEGYHMMPDGTIMPDSAHMSKGGSIEVKVGDKVKSKSVDGEVYESTGMFFKLKDKYGNKNPKLYSVRDFKKSEIKSLKKGGGKVKFADKVASIKKSLLERKKVPKAVQKDYGKTFSPAEAEDSAKRIVGSQTYAERIKYLTRKRKK